MDEDDDSDALIDPDMSDEEMADDGENPMAALLASAKARAKEYQAEAADGDGDSSSSEMDEDDAAPTVAPNTSSEFTVAPLRPESSRRAFDKIFKSVVASSDVILYVLDARDPEGTRSREVERSVMASALGEKRLILILNKIDLIPPAVLQAWLVHLRRSFPTLPLRASTPAPNAHTFNHRALTVASTSTTLFKALKAYAATAQLKRAITVGIIGYPNVGKSSVINALTSRLGGNAASCPVGAEAGVTTSLRQVKLDGKLKLLDSPGIVFPRLSSAEGKADRSDEQARLVLLNAVPPKQIEDPIAAVALLLRRLSASENMLAKLLEVYGLPPLIGSGTHDGGDQTMDFLVQVARKRGRLGKEGVPNIQSAAMTVVSDWRDGRVQGWVDAPVLKVVDDEVAGAEEGAAKEAVDQKKIVATWAKEFEIEGLWGAGTGEAEGGA